MAQGGRIKTGKAFLREKYLTETLRTKVELNWAKRGVKSYKGDGRTSMKPQE